VMSCPCGASDSFWSVLRAWKSVHVRVAPGLFPPKLVVQVKAWACELPSTHDFPLVSLEYYGSGARGLSVGLGRFYQRQFALAVARSRCNSTLVPP
jgi:hypothetical protein